MLRGKNQSKAEGIYFSPILSFLYVNFLSSKWALLLQTVAVILLILLEIVLGCELGIFSSLDPANELQDLSYRVATKGVETCNHTA